MPRKDRLKRDSECKNQAAASKTRKLESFFRSPNPTINEASSDDPSTLGHDSLDLSVPGPSSARDVAAVGLSASEGTSSTAEPGSSISSVISSDTLTPNQPKLTVASEDSKKKRRKPKTSIVMSWGYDWLQYVEENGFVMRVWCGVCRDHYQKLRTTGALNAGQAGVCDLEAFVAGTENVKKDTARSHAASKNHVYAVNAKSTIEQSQLYQAFMSMDDITQARLEKLFDIAYTIAFTEQPFVMFETWAAVENKHGVDLGRKYLNRKACKDFIEHIAGVMTDDLQASFTKEPFYCSILFDGSTDKSISEKEVVSIKVLENGIPTIRLLGIAEPKQCTAAGVYKGITDVCEERGLDLTSSLVASAADGAAVNFGEVNGVMTKLKQQAPWLIRIHCIAHRLELALKDAFKNTYFTEIDEVMMDLYYMYRRSGKRWRELQAVGDILDEHVVKPTRAQGTRWCDHRRKALSCLDTNYQSLITHFEEKSTGLRADIPAADAAKMKGFLKKMKNAKFVLFLAGYRDLVEDLADLSLAFQAQDHELPICDVRGKVMVTQAMLERKKQEPGANTKAVLAAIEDATRDDSTSFTYRDVEVRLQEGNINHFKRSMADTINTIVASTERRFSSLRDDPVIKAADVLDPANFPDDPAAFIKYGLDEVDVIMTHFKLLLEKKGCDLTQVPREWIKIKEDIRCHHRSDKLIALWGNMLTYRANRYPNLLHLVRILLVCPVSSSQVERQFSAIKRFLGDWRLSLKTSTIEKLLRISTEGPSPAAFDSKKAVKRWWSATLRRPGQQEDSSDESDFE